MADAIAYLNSRFPLVSQTFVLNEILELTAMGWDIELYPMIRESSRVSHPGMNSVMARAHFYDVPSRRCLRAQIYWARRKPAQWVKALALSLTLPGWHIRFLHKSIWCTLWAMMVAVDVKQRGIGHVHAHWATFPAHAALVVSRLTDCSFSFTAHAHDIYANAYGLNRKISEAAFVVTISELNRGILTRASHGAGKVEVVRCGIDPSRFPYRGPRSPQKRFRIVSVGSLEEKKGHRYLIEACVKLRDQGHQIDCRIIGDGPERTALERLIHKSQLEDSVALLGAQSSVQVAAELSEADVFVMPSVVSSNKLMEGIPVALMEAMAVGLPVIASHISGIPELVEDGVSGCLVPERDSDAIAEALIDIRTNGDLRAKLGAKAREVISVQYNLSINTRQLSDLFHSVLHR